jgi:hypothetical protein
MSFLPIDRVHGDHLLDRKAAAPLPRGSTFAPPSAIVGAADAPIEAITYRMWLGRPVAEVATAKGTRLFDAATGQALPAPTAREAEEIARLAWRGGARPAATVERIERASLEYRGTLLAWRVAFADPIPPASLSRPTPVGSGCPNRQSGGSTTSLGPSHHGLDESRELQHALAARLRDRWACALVRGQCFYMRWPKTRRRNIVIEA